MSVDNQLGFYFAVYTGLNTGAYIQVGSDLDLNDFLTINSSTSDDDTVSFTSNALTQFNNY
jgi:hypothetical protein